MARQYGGYKLAVRQERHCRCIDHRSTSCNYEWVWNHRNSINGLENINQLTASLKCVTNMWILYCWNISLLLYIHIYLTFRGACIVIYSYNKSQRDALFLKFIFIKNSICFGQIYCPSSGVSILYTQQ